MHFEQSYSNKYRLRNKLERQAVRSAASTQTSTLRLVSGRKQNVCFHKHEVQSHGGNAIKYVMANNNV